MCIVHPQVHPPTWRLDNARVLRQHLNTAGMATIGGGWGGRHCDLHTHQNHRRMEQEICGAVAAGHAQLMQTVREVELVGEKREESAMIGGH